MGDPMFEPLGNTASTLKVNRAQVQYLCTQSLLLHLIIEQDNSTRFVSRQYVAAFVIYLHENNRAFVKTPYAREFAHTEQAQKIVQSIKDKFDAELKKKPWFTIDEVAALLSVRPDTVREWVRRGTMNSKKRIQRGKEIYSITADDIKAACKWVFITPR